ncbi:MAG: hypothetical protein S4CHLAM123_00810 [Chlamydiales bacterium]|nr:hypothetical protein [Chlamydiales bacterium]
MNSIGFKMGSAPVNAENIDVRDVYGRTSLMRAVADKKINEIISLINQGADIEAQDDRGWTSLDRAIGSIASPDIKLNIINILLASGASMDVPNSKNVSRWLVLSNIDAIRGTRVGQALRDQDQIA